MLFDKGIKEYCLAAERVRRDFCDEITFKLSGPIDSSSPTSISEYELNNLVDKYGVEYLGNRKDMPELLASAIIFVLPSYYPEGLPKVLLEAAASGIPIITTDHPGCRDAIQDRETGILVNVKDHEAIASGIIELLTNHSLKKYMGERARLLAELSFNDESVVDDHYSLYRRLL
jgi:glycosyltransferase involved in cell wall biosynthesis